MPLSIVLLLVPFSLPYFNRQLLRDEAQARASLTTPLLVWEAPPEEDEESGRAWARTEVGQPQARPTAGQPLAFKVEKANLPGNPFAMGVTVGRVEHNDVALDDGSISRFHAWFQQDARTQEWSLVDAESRNGTWVDGVKLAPRERVQLKDGATLRFGDATLRFLLPQSFVAWHLSR
jgi:hypothetical protein